MAKNLTSFVKSVGSSSVNVEGLIPYCVWEFVPRTRFTCDRSCVNFTHEPFFCVPVGICCLRMEIWGAGGAPYGGQTCMYPGPSASGAYAWKDLTVAPGDCYRTHTAWYYCCMPMSGGSDTVKNTPCNNNNRHTWITGNGLTNFCAEHGCSASSVCCNTAPQDGSIQYQFQDSEGEGARYFGASGGARGRPGYIKLMDSALDNTDYRHYLQGIPYPAGYWNKRGGHLEAHMHGCSVNICCYAEATMLSVSDFHMTCNQNSGRWFMAGWGMPGASVCAGANVCGAYWNTGKIRISYSCTNNLEDLDK